MTITEQIYELLNINCMLLNIATIRQPYQGMRADMEEMYDDAHEVGVATTAPGVAAR